VRRQGHQHQHTGHERVGMQLVQLAHQSGWSAVSASVRGRCSMPTLVIVRSMEVR
jgi:hypothetical protein